MHTAPTVDYPVGPCNFRTFTLLLPAVSGMGIVAWWFSQSNAADWRQWTALASASASMVMLLMMWRNAPIGVLRWDGKSWRWEAAGNGVVGTLDAVLDLQTFLLLRFCAESGSVSWLWLERVAEHAARWGALRQALYASASATDASTPSAKLTGPDSVALK